MLERVTDQCDNLLKAVREAGRSGELKRYVQSHGRLFSDKLFTTDDYGDAVDASERIVQVVSSWKDDAKLTKAQEEVRSEILARLFEGYLYDGKTFSPKLKTIFAKLAQWMRRVYKGMETNGVTLTDDIVRAYDDLLTRKDSGVARAEGEGVMAQKSLSTEEERAGLQLLRLLEANDQKEHSYALPTKRLIEDVKKQTGIDITGVPHTANPDNLRHIRKKHMDGGKLVERNLRKHPENVALTGDDMKLFPYILNHYDTLKAVQAKEGLKLTYNWTDQNKKVYIIEEGFTHPVKNSPRLSLKTSWALGTAADVSSVSEPVRVPYNSNIASNSESVKSDVLAQAAYHGSAYLFDKFRTDKVNSGEGSQYFCWGLYFTQSKQIAAEYAQRQGDLKFKDGGRVAELPDLLSVMGGSESLKKFEDTVDRISGKPGRWKEVLDNFCVGIGASDNDILQAIDYASFETRPEGNTFKEMMASRSSGLTGKENAVKAALEDFLNTEEGLRFYDLSHTWGQRPHYVYSVELPDGKYLDWNAPMPEEDRQLIRSRFLQESGESLPDEIEGDPELDRPDNKFKTGRDFYRGLREMPYFRGEPRDISGFLHRLGYAGIVYDAGSIQGGGNGARNLVVFDENDIRITGKTLFQRVTAEQVQKARTRDMERIEKDAREALIRTACGGTRLMDIARECQSFEEFRDKVSDEFVRGQERIPRMSVDDFARISWDYARMLGSEGDDLYGDHELAVMAREAANAEDLKTWVEQNRPDIVQLMRSGTETSLETWLRALYHDANGTDGEAVQEATNVASILDEERRREKSLDNRFKELVGTDDGLVQVISAFSSDDTQLPPEARIVVDAANW